MIRLAAHLALASAMTVAFLPAAGAAGVSSAGAPLAQAEPNAGAGAALIKQNEAAGNYPPAAAAMAGRFNGLEAPVLADKEPGSDRLAMDNEPDKLVTTEGEVRVNLLIGHQLFSSDGRELGAIKDVLIGRHGEPQLIVEASDHLVAVPWSRLWFGLPGALLHGRPVLPGVTQRQLSELPAYKLHKRSG